MFEALDEQPGKLYWKTTEHTTGVTLRLSFRVLERHIGLLSSPQRNQIETA